MEHHNYRNIEKLEEKMRSYQSINYALIGGFVLCVFAAILWAVVTVVSGYQTGLMAIVVGVIVGVGVRYFGAGFDPIFSVIGGSYTLLSCLLGAIFTQIGFIMNFEGLDLMQVLSFLNFEGVTSMVVDSFSLMDLVFYGIAIYEGIGLSRRSLEPNTDPSDSLEPAFSSLRGPLIGTISIVLFCGLVYFTLQEPSTSTYYHDTGEKMSIGAYSSGYEDGEWEYFYKNGQTESKGIYKNGKQVGEWNNYYENGQQASTSNFENGLESGRCIAYYENGNTMTIWNSANGRLNGDFEHFHENGKLSSKGAYKSDRATGKWEYFYENGNKSSEGGYKDGEDIGKWTYWYESRKMKEVLEHKNTEDFKIVEAYDLNGKASVIDGTGNYSYFNEDGSIASTGAVQGGEKIGLWKIYNPNGKLKEEGEFENSIFKIKNAWNNKGQHIKNGNGLYKIYSELSGNLIESGEIKDGYKIGDWIYYHDSLQIPLAESEYIGGLLNGELVQYYENGKPSVKMKYKDDKPHGISTWYDEYEAKTSEVNFVNGNKEGVQSFWNGAGVLIKEELYENGVLIEIR
ncbi:MAG: antitoxin component YwqK of YwqJK toxin-antitoxin module [Saprospiraceae bacterium]|jgi:antitoxin component YwqK of YwqJK toxin-antitoxin module